jgi:hypothetical protein
MHQYLGRTKRMPETETRSTFCIRMPMLTKQLIRCALKEDEGFGQLPYVSRNRPGFLYGVDILEQE